VTRAPTLLHRAEYALFTGAARTAGVLPERAATRVAESAGRFAWRVLRIRRHVVETNLRLAFPGCDEAWIRRTAAASYAHLVREAVATLRAARRGLGALRTDVFAEGMDGLRAALEAGRGVVLFGGHFGNWELGVATVCAHGFPVDAMVRRQKNPLFDRALTEARIRLGMRVFDRERAARETLRALRANRVVAIIGDQDARRAGVFVPFFGRLASTTRGPAVLALRAGAAVVVMAPVRRPDGRLHVRYEPLDFDAGDRADDAALRLTAWFMSRLEALARTAPEQYLWHHRRWKTAPPGATGDTTAGRVQPGRLHAEP
jgi:KDO2-lipid IV(A) lauroyltransferase